MSYSDLFLECFFNTNHAGLLPAVEADSVYEKKAGQTDGDWVHLQYIVQNGVVKRAHFFAMGVPEVIAGAEYLCRYLEGKTFTQMGEINVTEVLQPLCFSRFKMHIFSLLQQLI